MNPQQHILQHKINKKLKPGWLPPTTSGLETERVCSGKVDR